MLTIAASYFLYRVFIFVNCKTQTIESLQIYLLFQQERINQENEERERLAAEAQENYQPESTYDEIPNRSYQQQEQVCLLIYKKKIEF